MILRDLLANVNITHAAADTGIEVHGISYDTRTLLAGELFVAIRGYESDGHKHIAEAVKKGAVCIICEQAPVEEIPHVIVEDSRKALAVVSAEWFHNPAEKMKIIGVTGTNGKTTAASLIKCVIEKCAGVKAGLIGTNGSLIGDREFFTGRTTPESYEIQKLLAMMVEEGCLYAVMEVSSHALYMDRVYGIEFEVGVFTNLTPEHLDFHGSMEQYAKTKAGLFENCRHAAVNIDDEYAPVMLGGARCHVMTYAVKDDTADLVAKSIKLHSNKVDFCALTIGNLHRVELNIPGMFSIYNALSTISAALLLGLPMENVAAALQTCAGVKGRAEVVPTGRDFTTLIDYAHTPDALENIIRAARGFTRGRVITLFGCGGNRDTKKRPLMGAIASKESDLVVVTSDNPRTEDPGAIIKAILAGMKDTKTPYEVIENRREAICWALKNARPGDVLILAGKGHETYQDFGKEKIDFDEREVVAEFFRQNPHNAGDGNES